MTNDFSPRADAVEEYSPARSARPTSDAVFVGKSELARLCRQKDWSTTPLGPVEQWPQSLRTTVNIVLGSTFPMIVLWGPELVQIYNDAYRLILGNRHPTGLGQPSLECWPEVTEVVKPMYDQVLAGETISVEEGRFMLAPDGPLEEFYLTICYTPVWVETGEVGGILATLFNVTGEVRVRAERDQALAEAEIERHRLAEVFQQAPSIIATLRGPEHIFEIANPTYMQLIGHRDILGKPIREVLPEIIEQGFVDLLDQVYATGEPFIGTEVLASLQQTPGAPLVPHYFNFIYQPLRAADGTTTGILAHGVDVTDQVESRQEIELKARDLTRLTQALENSNRELDQFAYITSHDLKAPLRGIGNLATWIEEDLGDAVSNEVREHLHLLRGRVVRMEALIDGILAYSRVGRTASTIRQVDVRALLDDVIDLLAPPATVSITIDPTMPTLATDQLMLHQVFANLIGNAIKHHPGPTIEIGVQATVHDGWAEFAVQDNGAGIAPEYRERIFGIFQMLASRDKVEGSGLGLALVKKIIEQQGGTIWLESAPGQGSTFFFTWPLQPQSGK